MLYIFLSGSLTKLELKDVFFNVDWNSKRARFCFQNSNIVKGKSLAQNLQFYEVISSKISWCHQSSLFTKKGFYMNYWLEVLE